LEVRVYVDGQRISGHRNRAGASRAGPLIRTAVLLAEFPSTVNNLNVAIGDARRFSLAATVNF
jgi:hypothetical protein